jgi:hypothetical protein
MFLLRYPGVPYDFLISGPGGMVAVCTRKSRRLHGALADIDSRHRETLAMISAAEFSPGLIRELWLWSPYGTMRFFRVEGPLLTELNRLGVPLSPPVTGTFTGKKKAGTKGPVMMKKNAKPGERIFPEKIPGPDAGMGTAAVPGPDPSPGQRGGREPAPIRYLRRRAQERRDQKDPPATPGSIVSDEGTPGAPPPAVGEDTSPS